MGMIRQGGNGLSGAVGIEFIAAFECKTLDKRS